MWHDFMFYINFELNEIILWWYNFFLYKILLTWYDLCIVKIKINKLPIFLKKHYPKMKKKKKRN